MAVVDRWRRSRNQRTSELGKLWFLWQLLLLCRFELKKVSVYLGTIPLMICTRDVVLISLGPRGCTCTNSVRSVRSLGEGELYGNKNIYDDDGGVFNSLKQLRGIWTIPCLRRQNRWCLPSLCIGRGHFYILLASNWNTAAVYFIKFILALILSGTWMARKNSRVDTVEKVYDDSPYNFKTAYYWTTYERQTSLICTYSWRVHLKNSFTIIQWTEFLPFLCVRANKRKRFDSSYKN